MSWIAHFIVSTAGSDSVGRGETLTHVHASELAFWPKSTAAEIFNGLLQAVPNTRETAVFIESTANGVTGLFYDLWKGAVDGTNGFVPVFIPWYIDPEYREPVPATSNAHQKKTTWSSSSGSTTSSSCSAGARSRRTASICGTRNTQQPR